MFEDEDIDELGGTGVSEDKQLKVIEELNDADEIQAAKNLILEELAEPEKDTSAKVETEPAAASEKAGKTDTSEETKKEDDKKQLEDGLKETQENEGKTEEGAETDKKPDPVGEGFTMTEEFINSQPEEVRGLLSKYKGKNKAEIAKAAAHAVSFTNEYLKDNQEATAAVAKKFEGYTTEELMKTLINTQKDVGAKASASSKAVIPEKDKLPPLPEDSEEVKAAISAQTAKRLKEKYPDMPEDINSTEHKEWLRDLQDEDLRQANKFLKDSDDVEAAVKGDLKQVVYVQNNYRDINNSRLENEVNEIKAELKKIGIDDPKAALGIDLSLEKDEKGSYYNEYLNSLMLNGEQVDSKVVGFFGKIPLLKTGELAQKFMYQNNAKVLTHLTNAHTASQIAEVERLKGENLNTLGGSRTSGPGSKTISIDEIEKTTDPESLQHEKDNILNSL